MKNGLLPNGAGRVHLQSAPVQMATPSADRLGVWIALNLFTVALLVGMMIASVTR